jgi:hypothetical protein
MAEIDVQIRAANSAIGHINLDLAGAGFSDGCGLDRKALVAPINCGLMGHAVVLQDRRLDARLENHSNASGWREDVK